jgi:hypothetical protein
VDLGQAAQRRGDLVAGGIHHDVSAGAKAPRRAGAIRGSVRARNAKPPGCVRVLFVTDFCPLRARRRARAACQGACAREGCHDQREAASAWRRTGRAAIAAKLSPRSSLVLVHGSSWTGGARYGPKDASRREQGRRWRGSSVRRGRSGGVLPRLRSRAAASTKPLRTLEGGDR